VHSATALPATASGPAPLNALTIDFEDWYQGLEIPHTEWGRFEERIEPAGRRLLSALAECRTRATFFVLGWIAERHPGLIREIAAAGHEIATHGWSHEFVYRLEPRVFRDELERSMRLLQELSGRPVIGHRAPFFSITRQSLWALDIMAELGIRYDSSIYPVVNYRYGIPGYQRWPHKVGTRGGDLIEFPISTWRLWGRNVPIAGGAYFRIFPYAITRRAFASIHREGHPGVFYLHPWELDPDHPRISLPARVAATHYFNLRGSAGRLRRLLRDFRFAPMREVLDVTG
jgi:polysaccharide deacetylase family protein (PEP-CTERM system associated)